MPNYTTTEVNEILKETLDAQIAASYDNNVSTLKMFKKMAPTEGITSLGRVFAIQLQDNESYGSMATEGGAFPAPGKIVDDRATVNYRSQFASFGFTGDVLDMPKNKQLMDSFSRTVKNTTEAFDAKQDMFLFGNGTGVIGQIDSVSSDDITMLNSVTYGYGARNIRKGQVLNAYDVSGTAYRTGDMTVTNVNRSTDVVSVNAAASGIASDDDDVLVFKGSYNYAPQGFAYHVNNTGSWLGLTRGSTNPGLNSIVYDASSATIDLDMVETALQYARNYRGDAAPKFDYKLITHPVNHRYLRAAARSSGNLSYNTQVSGTKKADLLVQDIAIAGMAVHESSNCSPSDMWGIQPDSWAIEEMAPRQLYRHNDGNILIQQIVASTSYGDAKEGRVYWRYNVVCKEPFKQFRIKNLNFSTADTRIGRA